MPRGEPTRSLPTRFTDGERAELEAAAADRGVPVTGFVRAAALAMARSSGKVEWLPSARQPPARSTVKPPAAVEARSFLARSPRPLERVRPAHARTCKCGVCRPPKSAKS